LKASAKKSSKESGPTSTSSDFKRGDIVFKEGDLGDSLYLVGEGSIKISKQGRGGRQEVLDYIQTGNFFGEDALLSRQPHSAMASAAEPTLLGAVKEADFPAHPGTRAQPVAHELSAFDHRTHAQRELAFHYRNHAQRTAQSRRVHGKLDHSRSQEPDLHRALLL
jgi:CRP-like cAMP-binding protein